MRKKRRSKRQREGEKYKWRRRSMRRRSKRKKAREKTEAEGKGGAEHEMRRTGSSKYSDFLFLQYFEGPILFCCFLIIII